jgi:tight adherence protein B
LPAAPESPVEAPLQRTPGEKKKLFSFGGSGYSERVQMSLERAGMNLRPGEFLLIRIAMAAVPTAIIALLGQVWLMPVTLIGGYFLPRWYVSRKWKKRINHIDSQLVEALQLMSNALKAGFGMMQAIDAVATQVGGPLGEELRTLQRDTAVGLNPDEALAALSKRCQSYDLDIVTTAITIQRAVGGNLAEILDQVGETMRERERIQGEIKALTSQQRMTGYIIALLPIFIGGLFYLINADYMNPLVNSLGGRVLVGAAAFMEVVGMFIIKRIVDIDV